MKRGETGPDGTVAKSTTNGLVGTEFASRLMRVFKGSVGRCVGLVHPFLSH